MEEKPQEKKPPAKPEAKAAEQPNPQADIIAALKEKFSEAILDTKFHLGQNFIYIKKDRFREICRYLKESPDARYVMLTDVTAVDYPNREKRFELIYMLYSFQRNDRLFLKMNVADGEAAPSVVPVWAGANWLEREVYDMFGIEFEGHPDLKRILLPEGWHGHPLRRDYDIRLQDEEWIKANLEIRPGP